MSFEVKLRFSGSDVRILLFEDFSGSFWDRGLEGDTQIKLAIKLAISRPAVITKSSRQRMDDECVSVTLCED